MSVAEAHGLAEANTYNTAQVEHPLTRTVTVTIRSSLNDLCLKKAKATWAPSSDAIRSILQQRKFTDLTGNSEQQGALNSVVMHELSVASHQNTFPLAVGARVTGVDDQAYSVTGDAYSHIVAPQSSTHTGRLLQKDDVSLGARPTSAPSVPYLPNTPQRAYPALRHRPAYAPLLPQRSCLQSWPARAALRSG